MGDPFTVVIAETQKCSQKDCGGRLKWIGGETLGIPPSYILECRKCGCHHSYQQDDGSPTQIKLGDVTYFPNDEARLDAIRVVVLPGPIEFLAHETVGPAAAHKAPDGDGFMVYEEPGEFANLPPELEGCVPDGAEPAKPDAPVDLMDAAKILAKQLNKEVFVTPKPGNGVFKLPYEYWGISLVQDMYAGWYCVQPDGTVLETEQYT